MNLLQAMSIPGTGQIPLKEAPIRLRILLAMEKASTRKLKALELLIHPTAFRAKRQQRIALRQLADDISTMQGFLQKYPITIEDITRTLAAMFVQKLHNHPLHPQLKKATVHNEYWNDEFHGEVKKLLAGLKQPILGLTNSLTAQKLWIESSHPQAIIHKESTPHATPFRKLLAHEHETIVVISSVINKAIGKILKLLRRIPIETSTADQAEILALAKEVPLTDQYFSNCHITKIPHKRVLDNHAKAFGQSKKPIIIHGKRQWGYGRYMRYLKDAEIPKPIFDYMRSLIPKDLLSKMTSKLEVELHACSRSQTIESLYKRGFSLFYEMRKRIDATIIIACNQNGRTVCAISELQSDRELEAESVVLWNSNVSSTQVGLHYGFGKKSIARNEIYDYPSKLNNLPDHDVLGIGMLDILKRLPSRLTHYENFKALQLHLFDNDLPALAHAQRVAQGKSIPTSLRIDLHRRLRARTHMRREDIILKVFGKTRAQLINNVQIKKNLTSKEAAKIIDTKSRKYFTDVNEYEKSMLSILDDSKAMYLLSHKAEDIFLSSTLIWAFSRICYNRLHKSSSIFAFPHKPILPMAKLDRKLTVGRVKIAIQTFNFDDNIHYANVRFPTSTKKKSVQVLLTSLPSTRDVASFTNTLFGKNPEKQQIWMKSPLGEYGKWLFEATSSEKYADVTHNALNRSDIILPEKILYSSPTLGDGIKHVHLNCLIANMDTACRDLESSHLGTRMIMNMFEGWHAREYKLRVHSLPLTTIPSSIYAFSSRKPLQSIIQPGEKVLLEVLNQCIQKTPIPHIELHTAFTPHQKSGVHTEQAQERILDYFLESLNVIGPPE